MSFPTLEEKVKLMNKVLEIIQKVDNIVEVCDVEVSFTSWSFDIEFCNDIRVTVEPSRIGVTAADAPYDAKEFMEVMKAIEVLKTLVKDVINIEE